MGSNSIISKSKSNSSFVSSIKTWSGTLKTLKTNPLLNSTTIKAQSFKFDKRDAFEI
jgi:hypothetical protein